MRTCACIRLSFSWSIVTAVFDFRSYSETLWLTRSNRVRSPKTEGARRYILVEGQVAGSEFVCGF